MSGPRIPAHVQQYDKDIALLTESQREYEKTWPQKPGLSMEDVGRRLGRYGSKDKMRIPTRGREQSAQSWREQIVNTAREAQFHIVREKAKDIERMGPPQPAQPSREQPRRGPPAGAPPPPVENPPRPWGGRSQAVDRHSTNQVRQSSGGLLNPGGGKRRRSPDETHSNEEMAELQSASESESGGYCTM